MNTDKRFIYGLSSFSLNDTILGYIEKDSYDWGGSEPETVDVNAEQVPGQPVLVLLQKNGTVEPQFNLIQLDAANMAAVLGGTVTNGKWSAPTTLTQISGKVKIVTVSGHTIEMPSVTVAANITGKLALSEVSKVQVKLKVALPADGSAPITIDGLDVTAASSSDSTTQAG